MKQVTAAPESQPASAVLMVRPAAFASNAETAASNPFQSRARAPADTATRALAEFDAAARALDDVGVAVHTFEGRRDASCPDEVFPNNWISFHADGTAVLYPLLAPSRRRERRTELLDALGTEHGYRIARTIDLTAHEGHGRFLEGTGSVVLDRIDRIAYACRSPRTNRLALADFADRLGYETILFDAVDVQGVPIYHTNVVMSVGIGFAVVCLQAIRDEAVRMRITAQLERAGHSVIAISLAQLYEFAANILELRGCDGPVIALSARALAAFDDRQRSMLESHGQLVAVAIPTIETYGGGSLRCMLAEIHLDR